MMDPSRVAADRVRRMVEIEEALTVVEERAKRVGQAIDEAEVARARAKKELDSLPADLAALREQLRRSISDFPIADNLESR
jgi:F0F1-type ATP synthase membrane subunit b/b'